MSGSGDIRARNGMTLSRDLWQIGLEGSYVRGRVCQDLVVKEDRGEGARSCRRKRVTRWDDVG
jgi:hypothetical protein